MRRRPLDALSPLTVEDAASMMDNSGLRWWLAGGGALDRFVGHPTRRHADLDLAVLRSDHAAVPGMIGERWQLVAVREDSSPDVVPWEPATSPADEVTSVWGADAAGDRWVFEILFLETEGDRWVFRRDPRIGGRVDDLGWTAADGIPALRPEIHLLYKAKYQRAKDDTDFDSVHPLLSPDARTWLRWALQLHRPGHPWLRRLG